MTPAPCDVPEMPKPRHETSRMYRYLAHTARAANVRAPDECLAHEVFIRFSHRTRLGNNQQFSLVLAGVPQAGDDCFSTPSSCVFPGRPKRRGRHSRLMPTIRYQVAYCHIRPVAAVAALDTKLGAGGCSGLRRVLAGLPAFAAPLRRLRRLRPLAGFLVGPDRPPCELPVCSASNPSLGQTRHYGSSLGMKKSGWRALKARRAAPSAKVGPGRTELAVTPDATSVSAMPRASATTPALTTP
jgi:hypothetical protein